MRFASRYEIDASERTLARLLEMVRLVGGSEAVGFGGCSMTRHRRYQASTRLWVRQILMALMTRKNEGCDLPRIPNSRDSGFSKDKLGRFKRLPILQAKA
ncbi:MAG: hypothetical protein CL912_09695 [Deltaproteobacteria bacterium]|nr:hypothetical protein [Deltaproteobacteria bacterium]